MATLWSKIRGGLSRRTKHHLLFVAAGVGLLLLVTPLPVHAFLGANFFGQIILAIATGIGYVARTSIGILIQVVQYNDFINAPAVVKGWVVVRDTVNMFFIVALLAIAFGTVFRMEEYQYKHVLGKMLTMAVLVNFSKSIAGFFIDFSQVITLTFVNGFKDAAAGNFINGFHLKDMFQFAEQADPTQIDQNTFFYAALLALVTITIATVVVQAYLIIFVLRIVALWFLIVISPLAFLANAWPGKGHEYHEQWWEYFGKYASTGPILAFFLWLSLAVMQFSSSALGSFSINTPNPISAYITPAAAITGIGQSDVLLSFILSIIMLIAGLWMASKLGVVGGNFAVSMAKGVGKLGIGAVKAPLKTAWNYAGRKYNEKMPTWANPVALVRGWQERGKELGEESKTISAAGGRQLVTKVLTGGRVKIPFKDIAKRQIEAKHYKEFAHMHRDEKAFAAASLGKKGLFGMKGGAEAETLRASLALGGALESHQDDIIASKAMANDYEWVDKNGKKQKGLAVKVDEKGEAHYDKRGELTKDEKEKGWTRILHNQRIVLDYYRSFLDKEDSARVAYDAGEAMKKVGHFQGVEIAGFDPGKKKLFLREDESAAEEAVGELSKQPGRALLSNNQAHSYREIREDPHLGIYWALGEEGSYEDLAEKAAFYGRTDQRGLGEIENHANVRLAGSAFGYHKKDDRFVINDNVVRDTKIKERSESARYYDQMQSLYKKSGAQGFIYLDENGKEVARYDSLDNLIDKGLPSSTKIPGAASPWTRPPGKKPVPAPMVDINAGKLDRTNQARESFADKPGNKGKDFFASEEYRANGEEYYDEDTYYQVQGLQHWQEEHDGGLSVNSFARGQKNEMAVDFSKLGVDWLTGKAGIHIAPEQIQQIAKALGGVIAAEIRQLEAKPDRTTGDDMRLGYLRTAQEKLGHPEDITDLSLYNTNREGVGARRLITHEDMHVALGRLDPDESVQREIWEKLHTTEERKQIVEQVRKKQDNPDMTEDEARREYFAEGLANETTWGDKSETAIKLKPQAREQLMAVTQQTIAPGGKSPETAKPKASTVPSVEQQVAVPTDVRIAMENAINVQGGGFGNVWSELSTSPSMRREFFKPLLGRLEDEFRKMFNKETELSADMSVLRDKITQRLNGLKESLGQELKPQEFTNKFADFLKEFGGFNEPGSNPGPTPSQSSPPISPTISGDKQI